MRTARAWKHVHSYVLLALGEFNAELKPSTLVTLAVSGPSGLKRRIPSHIFLEATKARPAFDTLVRNGELSEASRRTLEPGIAELEQSLAWARQVKGQLSVGQKELIQSLVQPYLDAIRAKAPNAETARDWIHYAATQMRSLGPDECTKTIRTVLQEHFGSMPDKTAEFYESLCMIARTYEGLYNIEVALAQTGDGIPNLYLIQQAINEMLVWP
jgi:hypothetical protein